MATTNADFEGPAGNFSFYKRNGQTIVRTKGGPSKQQIKNAASCKGIRNSNAEFGGGSKICSLLRRAIGPCWKQYSDSDATGKLSGKLRILIGKGEGIPGRRIADAAAHPEVLKGFEFNKHSTWNNRFKQAVAIEISEDRDAAVMKLSFCPVKDLTIPEGATSFRIMHTLIRLPSYGMEENKGYVPLYGASIISAQAFSSAFYTDLNIQVKIALPVHLPFTPSAKGVALVCIAGIGFYTETGLMDGVNVMKIVKVC